MVMVLNALELPAPAVPAFNPYRTFTQDSDNENKKRGHVLVSKK